MAENYTKLFGSIISSTIWTEDDQTRILWITLLAMADKNGEIQGSIPGLARIAGINIEDAKKAFHKFLSPDPYSRTKDDEGRRLEEVEGGWALINHAKYRKMASKEDSKAKNAERQRRYREKQKRNASVTDSNASVTPSRDIAEAEAEADPLLPPKSPRGSCLSAEELISKIPSDWLPQYRGPAEEWARDKQARGLKRQRIQSLNSWEKCLKRMALYPANVLSEAIDQAIASGWQGWEQDSVKDKMTTKPQPTSCL